MRKLLILFVLLIVAAVSAVAQFDEVADEDLIFGDVRVVNALVGIGPVDVYVNEQLVAVGLEPEQF